MKNETFTPERIKAEADAFFEWDGEDRSLVTTTSCLLFAQHIAGLMQARSAQPAPVVPEGYVLVPKSMWVDAASIEALAFVMGGPEEDDGSPTYCDCVMWVGEIDDDGVKRHGIHVYNTECEEEGSTTLAEFAAAPAQGQQVECQERRAALLKVSRDADKLRAELAALKAQQVGQEPVAWRMWNGKTWRFCYSDLHGKRGWEALYTSPQPAPAQDVAEDWSVFIGYLIDKCEGHEISEERLQFWLRDMLDDPHYGALFRREKELAEQPSAIALSIEAAEEEHGSLRAAAKALDVDHGYLSRLKNGDKSNPSDELLAKLGLERLVIYRTAAHDKQSGGEV